MCVDVWSNRLLITCVFIDDVRGGNRLASDTFAKIYFSRRATRVPEVDHTGSLGLNASSLVAQAVYLDCYTALSANFKTLP